jgi:hypothetical protein
MVHCNNIALTMLHVDMFKQYNENQMKWHEYGEMGVIVGWASLNKVGSGGEKAKAKCVPTLSQYNLRLHRAHLPWEAQKVQDHWDLPTLQHLPQMLDV